MRLINVGAGEVCDRLSILALKILYGKQASKDTKHFETERAVLLTQLAGRTLNSSWFGVFLELQAVNAAGWQAQIECRARAHAVTREEDEGVVAEHYHEAGRLAFQMQAWNDQRSGLIDEINKLTGEHLGEEKL